LEGGVAGGEGVVGEGCEAAVVGGCELKYGDSASAISVSSTFIFSHSRSAFRHSKPEIVTTEKFLTVR
jgi:hypothetical protein